MRKPSPISISSPRETSTSRPSASAAKARRTAAALVLTTSAAPAPGRRPRRAMAAQPRPPAARLPRARPPTAGPATPRAKCRAAKSAARLAAGAFETMPYSVLQPVKRRRRSRSRRPLVLLAVALLAGAASFAATQHWAFAHGAPGHRRQSAPLTPKPVSAASLERLRAAASEQQVAARAPFVSGTHLLLRAAPRLEHAGLRPIVAPAAILVDASTGAVLWAKRPHERRPIASTTKIMTGVLALEHLPLSKVVRVNPLVTRVALNREGLRAHEHVAVWKLMEGLLLFSGNDDALQLAITTAGSRGAFLRLMNEKASLLGLRDTHYTSPSGVVDRGNYSSAYDLAALPRYP